MTVADLNLWVDTQGSTTDLRADIDDNGIVNAADRDIILGHFELHTLTLFGV